ncbi:hypothetical protein RIF29_21198 [Crotalaria pallida]|uniref:Uncharacterized protein n=1 Tax=Crotalaria pallida TaxID=3830 RepID=A0AAN9F2L0_CROPI
MAIGAPPVEMTTGATITTQGLKMTVTHRTKPIVVPSLQMSPLEVDPFISLSDKDEISQKRRSFSVSVLIIICRVV